MKIFKKKARWIYYRGISGLKQCKCSNCKSSYGCLDTPYCPNCGRRMSKDVTYESRCKE